MAAEDAAFKVRHQTDLVQLQLDLETVGARRTGDAPAMAGMDGADRLMHVANGHQIAFQRGVAARPEAGQPVLGHPLSGHSLDQRRLVLDRLADKQPHAFRRAERPALLGEHVAQNTVGDRLGIDQHTITVKQYRIKAHEAVLQSFRPGCGGSAGEADKAGSASLATPHEGVERIGRHRSREQVALAVIATYLLQKVALLRGLDTLGNHLHAQLVCHHDDGLAQ